MSDLKKKAHRGHSWPYAVFEEVREAKGSVEMVKVRYLSDGTVRWEES